MTILNLFRAGFSVPCGRNPGKNMFGVTCFRIPSRGDRARRFHLEVHRRYAYVFTVCVAFLIVLSAPPGLASEEQPANVAKAVATGPKGTGGGDTHNIAEEPETSVGNSSIRSQPISLTNLVEMLMKNQSPGQSGESNGKGSSDVNEEGVVGGGGGSHESGPPLETESVPTPSNVSPELLLDPPTILLEQQTEDGTLESSVGKGELSVKEPLSSEGEQDNPHDPQTALDEVEKSLEEGGPGNGSKNVGIPIKGNIGHTGDGGSNAIPPVPVNGQASLYTEGIHVDVKEPTNVGGNSNVVDSGHYYGNGGVVDEASLGGFPPPSFTDKDPLSSDLSKSVSGDESRKDDGYESPPPTTVPPALGELVEKGEDTGGNADSRAPRLSGALPRDEVDDVARNPSGEMSIVDDHVPEQVSLSRTRFSRKFSQLPTSWKAHFKGETKAMLLDRLWQQWKPLLALLGFSVFAGLGAMFYFRGETEDRKKRR